MISFKEFLAQDTTSVEKTIEAYLFHWARDKNAGQLGNYLAKTFGVPTSGPGGYNHPLCKAVADLSKMGRFKFINTQLGPKNADANRFLSAWDKFPMDDWNAKQRMIYNIVIKVGKKYQL